ncbi:DUF2812 domain-containing protein [Carnobacterium maltaromaticum]|uniref:DUF2812 domain-containing protein n=1 Tax=Carnobacterium maltaromaticum LMA28 TaxID=1234679 RepID=K8E1F2_CARML|nr:DUF2812 domain-containing protein [Carnobacterium maltaromaticum]TFJ61360.1 DUF2812 domain-containing protein [Carnobacterium maltaromaticum]CCO09627.2 putative uncharacterized protein [Carnobacterium maltaromaticum LMA28]
MKKFKLFIDMKKEEQYLKEMAEKGWGLVKYSAYNRYTFEKIHPESLSYRIDYQMFKKKGDYIDYLTLFEDSGWKHISGSQSSGFHFFLPENDNNQDLDIFSDSQSSRARYKRLYNQATLWVALMIVYFILLQPSFENISSWYLAPTIWEYSGLQLVGMIVMQTFFVLIQLLPMLIFMSGAVIYALIGTKAKKLATM